jgi:hypothetical protein
VGSSTGAQSQNRRLYETPISNTAALSIGLAYVGETKDIGILKVHRTCRNHVVGDADQIKSESRVSGAAETNLPLRIGPEDRIILGTKKVKQR